MRLKLNKILVPTDFSNLSLKALHYAAAVARYTEAEIVLLHVVETYEHNVQLNQVVDVNAVVQKAINEKLQQIKKENVDLWNIKITAKLVNGKIHREIENITKTEKIDLIVMGTHGVSGLGKVEKFVLGSNAYRTVHVSKCPVITIRESKEKPQFKTIVLPIDTTKETKQKIKAAISLARIFNSTIHVISVSTFFEEFRYNLSELNQQVKEVADAIVKEKIDVKVKMIRHEDVAGAVLDYSEEVDADLIMIMVREENKMNELVLGSRARKVITRSKVPVFSMRPK